MYSDSFYTNGSDGAIVGLSEKEKEQIIKRNVLSKSEIDDLAKQALELEGE